MQIQFYDMGKLSLLVIYLSLLSILDFYDVLTSMSLHMCSCGDLRGVIEERKLLCLDLCLFFLVGACSCRSRAKGEFLDELTSMPQVYGLHKCNLGPFHVAFAC